jgi:hypothetical protein
MRPRNLALSALDHGLSGNVVSIPSTRIVAALLAVLMVIGPSYAADRGFDLKPGETLFGASDDALVTNSVKFVMQHDCNLVAYRGAKPIWATNTDGDGGACRLVMQTDGNLVIYRGGDNKVVWASNTQGHPGAHLVAQWDGNVVMYQGAHAMWATNTDIRPKRTPVSHPSIGPFAGCAFARTETKCVVAVMLCKAVYACGFNPASATPVERSESWEPCGGCIGLDF